VNGVEKILMAIWVGVPFIVQNHVIIPTLKIIIRFHIKADKNKLDKITDGNQ
jgi:hypothetical protein